MITISALKLTDTRILDSTYLFHGSRTPQPIIKQAGPILFLAEYPEDAAVFATDPLFNHGRSGKPYLYRVQVNACKIKDISDIVNEALEDSTNIDNVIKREADIAKKESVRTNFVWFWHPGHDHGDFRALVALHPEYLRIDATFDL